MTVVRHLVITTLVSAAALCLVSSCRPTKALDVTAPDDEKEDLDYDISDDDSGGSGKRSKGDAFDPCDQQKCGTPCMQCDPTDQSCDELQVQKACNLDGDCVVAPVDCTVEEKEKEEEEKE